MDPQDRYQIVDTIAQGDFATVYRARDNELGREVAIKQIHQQYLADPTKLERYWQEAQLLANTEHPYIMTIYDIVRDRGWLILELMQGSLQQKLNGEPIDLEDLRLTLTYMLHALHFLEQQGIVHGDIKPSNLLLDKNHRVKLGDFGIARHLAGDDGSVIKGTTKYMAPEVVSDQFGTVGPHSDLYSLGFSAYELMAGSHFDTLFPSLNMYGRDPQMAWIMWHTAGDQRLPEIPRVLQGVPEDLAHVIQKLVEKNPANRYPNAEKALLELRAGGEGGDDTLTAEEKAQLAQGEKSQKRKRMLLIGALFMSVCMSMLMLFADVLFKAEPPPKPAPKAGPTDGIVVAVHLEDNLLEIDPGNGDERFPINFNAELDSILINGETVELTDLEKGDRIHITRLKTEDGKKLVKIEATRQTGSVTSSTITHIDLGEAVVKLAEKKEDGTEMAVYVPAATEIILNGESKIAKRNVALKDLNAKDRVRVEHVPGEKIPFATKLTALRVVSASGELVALDTDKRTITMRDDNLPRAAPRVFRVSKECKLSLNGEVTLADGRAVTMGDLKSHDTISISRDEFVLRISAIRGFTDTGIVAGIDADRSILQVDIAGKTSTVGFKLGKNCPISLATSGTAITLDFLRPGDSVTIAHMSATLVDAEAKTVKVTPKSIGSRWAIVIGQQAYDDLEVPKVTYTKAATELIVDALTTYYRIPSDQVQLHIDATRPKLEGLVPTFLQRVGPTDQLLVYFAGHGYLDETKQPVLATKEFRMKKLSTGLPLKWLISQMELHPAGERILLLDSCLTTTGSDAKTQPSTTELVSALRNGPTRPVSTSVHVLASCAAGQRGLVLRDTKQGLFATAVSDAMRGAADLNDDRSIDIDELFGYLQNRMSRLSDKSGGTQTPYRFIPDANPPRLLAETKEAVNQLLGYMRAVRFDNEITTIYNQAKLIQPEHPDVALAYALVMLKHNRTGESQSVFESLRAQFPDELLPYHALAWQYFSQKKYRNGMADLIQLVNRLPEPDPDRGYGLYDLHLLDLTGRMGMFAFEAAEPALDAAAVAPLTQAVKLRGENANKLYLQGAGSVKEAVTKLDDRFKITNDDEKKATLLRERRRLTFYVDFGYDQAVEYLKFRIEN